MLIVLTNIYYSYFQLISTKIGRKQPKCIRSEIIIIDDIQANLTSQLVIIFEGQQVHKLNIQSNSIYTWLLVKAIYSIASTNKALRFTSKSFLPFCPETITVTIGLHINILDPTNDVDLDLKQIKTN